MDDAVDRLITSSTHRSKESWLVQERYGIVTCCLGDHASAEDHFIFVGGIHGDETSGSLGMLDFIQNYTASHNTTAITIIPFANEYGYLHRSRFDAQGRDLNRVWNQLQTNTTLPLVLLFQELLKVKKPRCIVTLHEDDEQIAHYAYTYIQPEDRQLFDRVWKTMRESGNVTTEQMLYGLEVNEGCISTVLDDYSLESTIYTQSQCSVINLELTDSKPIEENIATVTLFLNSLLDNFSSSRI